MKRFGEKVCKAGKALSEIAGMVSKVGNAVLTGFKVFDAIEKHGGGGEKNGKV